MDSPKSIIKLVAVTFIIFLIIVLVINIGNNNKQQANKQNLGNAGIKEIKNNDNDYEEGINTELEPIEDTREDYYDAPDTASNAVVDVIIGTIIISSGMIYIYKHN